MKTRRYDNWQETTASGVYVWRTQTAMIVMIVALFLSSSMARPPASACTSYCTPSCGDTQYYEGVPVCGECVWFVQRYICEKYGVPPPGLPYACQWWTNGVPGMDKIANDGTNYPQYGDVLVWTGTECGQNATLPYGHVAIVKSATSRSNVVVVESNWTYYPNRCGDTRTEVQITSQNPGWLRYHNPCTPANVWWTGTPASGWYRTNERLTYAWSGSNISVDEGPRAGNLGEIYLNEAGQGWHDYWAHAENGCGNATRYWSGGFDDQPPSISITAPATGTWLNGNPTVSWSITDATSGVASATRNGGSIGATGSWTLPEGKSTANFHVVDVAGNARDESRGEFWVDRTAPATSASPSPSVPDGESGWYVDCVSVTLAASDSLSGVAGIHCKLDGNESSYGAPFQVCGDGVHTIEYWSDDNAGNSEPHRAYTISIDGTAPVFTLLDDGADSSLDTLFVSWTANDATSGVAEYQYAIGSTPGAEDIVPWTSTGNQPWAYRTNLALEPWKTYYFKVKARDNAGNWSDPVVSDGVTAVPKESAAGTFNAGGVSSGVDPDVRRSPSYAIVDSLGQFVVGESSSPSYIVQHGYWGADVMITECSTLAEMRHLPDGWLVRLIVQNPVTAGTDKFFRRFYMESADRSSGLLARWASGPDVASGDLVTVCGRLDTIDGERCLELATVESKSAGGDTPGPLYMSGRTIGGEGAILDGFGLYNIGLLIRTAGTVTFKSPDGSFFYVDDGSDAWDGSPHRGVRVSLDALAPGNTITAPSEGLFVVVTGQSSVAIVNNQAVRAIRPRDQGDVVF